MLHTIRHLVLPTDRQSSGGCGIFLHPRVYLSETENSGRIRRYATDFRLGNGGGEAARNTGDALSNHPNTTVNTPQVFNFVKELQCRHHSLEVSPVLQQNGAGKVVVDIGLDKGKEIKSG
jgi:hypothetical protein